MSDRNSPAEENEDAAAWSLKGMEARSSVGLGDLVRSRLGGKPLKGGDLLVIGELDIDMWIGELDIDLCGG